MMQITDVIRVMGSAPLEKFPWGLTVRDTVNLFLDSKENQLTEKSTGADIQAAIDSLPDDVKELVLKAKLDPSRHCITTSVGGGMVVEHPETGESKDGEDPVEGLKKAFMRPLSIVTTMMVILVVSLAVLMVSDLSVNKDFDWDGLFRAIREVFAPTSGK